MIAILRGPSLALLLTAHTALAAAPLEIHVDPRVELVSALFRLAGAREYSQGRSPYLEALAAHLAAHREHPAVAATRKLREQGIGYDAPMQLALYLDPRTLRPLRPLAPRPPGLDARWEGQDIDAYLDAVRDFAKVARFDDFLAAQAPRFARVEARFRELAAKHDLQPWLDATYGRRKGARSVVVPGMQSGGGNFGITVALPGGGEVLVQILALESPDAEGLPRPGDATLSLWAHEASHPYVNPLVDQHFARLAAAGETLHALVAEPMRKQAYPDARIMLCESLVRAEVIRFLRARLGDKAARRAARDDDGRGFVWIDELVATLDAAPGPLPKAMPRVITFFETTAARFRAEGLPARSFRGPIDAIYRGRTTVLAARSLVAPIGDVLRRIDARASAPGAAETATWAAIPGSLVIYAAPSSSPLVAETLARHGERVTPEGIEVAGQRFAGGDLVLIVAHPRADAPTAGVVLYTASRDELLVGVNSVFHGPTDWLVARRGAGGKLETLGSGDF